MVDHAPDYVVVGEGRTASWDMLESAVQMIIDGAKLIATNLDPNCPTKSGTRPGCGATVSFIETTTDAMIRSPTYVNGQWLRREPISVELQEELGGQRILAPGMHSDQQGERVLQHFTGMIVTYAPDGRVSAVESR